MGRRSGRIPLRGGDRKARLTDWGVGTGSQAVTTFSASGVSIIGAGLTPLEKLTLVRTRGIIDIHLGSATSDGDGYMGAFGICRVAEAAFDIGITALPTPVTEANWDGWFYHTYFSVHRDAGGVENAGSSHFRDMIDGKSMRIFAPEDIFVAVMEVTETGTSVLRVHHDSRMLFKLG